MSARSLADVSDLAAIDIDGLVAEQGIGACCAAVYEQPAVRWLLGDELHPGGARTTRRGLELIRAQPGDRLLDVGSGSGASALLAARELGCEVVGVDLGERAVRLATEASEAEGLQRLARFARGDAAALPFEDASFDAALSECTISTVADKSAALVELHRTLRPEGRLYLSDVIVESELPGALRGPMATIACVGSALDTAGYVSLLEGSGFAVEAIEPRTDDAAQLAHRVEDRLRGARLLGFPEVAGLVELAGLAIEAIADGRLGYSIFAASRR
jgi:SAM-dependent methyltransferase